MDFGKPDISLLDQLDLRLPADGNVTAAVLTGKPDPNFRFRLGLTHWGRKEWVGKLYPPKTKEKEFLGFYGKQFNTVELNATHYKLYEAAGLTKWKETVGMDFVFCPKLFKDISHKGSLLDKEILLQQSIDNFLEGFADQLGPVFIQLSEYFGPKRQQELFQFLHSLDKRVTWFLEVREANWFTSDTLFRILQEEKIGAVITDTAGRRDCAHMQVTIPHVFIRFVANDQHPSDFTRLDDWAERLKDWKARGLEEVNFFVHCSDENKVLEIAQYAIERFNAVVEARLKPLKLDGSGGQVITAPTLF